MDGQSIPGVISGYGRVKLSVLQIDDSQGAQTW